MRLSLVASLLLPFTGALPSMRRGGHGREPPIFFLAGDSTVAHGGGWGDGFLTFPRDGAQGINFGVSGATTVSFKEEGHWKNLTDHVKQSTGDFKVYVTIQFGHNDQKEQANITHQEFQANLEAMAREIQDLGGKSVLISSLTRRTFDADGNVIENLKDERRLAGIAAAETDSTFLDLNEASTDYVNAIGESASHEYNLTPDDDTHLNEHGGVVFGRMVADLLLDKIPHLGRYITPDEEISEAIRNGEPA